jgi:type IV secretory pathway TraG/TraD family ATPase VirD4
MLPDTTSMPDFFFIILIGVSCLGIIYHKKNYKTIYYVITLIFTFNWIFVQAAFPGILDLSIKLTTNKYLNFVAEEVAVKISYVPFYIGIIFILLSARILRSLQIADPMFKSSDDDANTVSLMKKVKAIRTDIKSAFVRIKQISKVETIDKDGKTKKPLLKIMVQIVKLILNPKETSPYKDYYLEICTDVKTQEKVRVGFFEMFLHFLIVGPTGCGKTSRIIKPIAWQIIKFILIFHQKTGLKFGLTIVEPKGDLADDVAHWCKKLNIPHVHIDPLNPNSAKINPLQGDAQVAAESTRMVLRKLFGKQDAFFAQVQETAARNTILLLKKLKGDQLDLGDVIRTLRDPENLKKLVQQLEQKEGQTDLVQYFQYELLGSLKDRYQQFAMGLRMQLEDLMGNDMLKNVITGDSDINFDEHLDNGGILLVNTAMGQLGKLGDAFGSFIIMHFQNAVFRRPGNERTRTPHVLIVDEAPRYINPDIERLLAIGRSFRCACLLVIQSLGQLQLEEKMAFANIVLTNCRNKIIFGGLEEADALKFEKELGKIEQSLVQPSFDHKKIMPNIFPKNFRVTRQLEPRFTYTEIIELEEYTFLYRLMKGSKYVVPGIGESELVTSAVIDQFKPLIKIDKPDESPAPELKRPQNKIVFNSVPGSPNTTSKNKNHSLENIRFIPPNKPPGKKPKKQTPVSSEQPIAEEKPKIPETPAAINKEIKTTQIKDSQTTDTINDDFWSALSDK